MSLQAEIEMVEERLDALMEADFLCAADQVLMANLEAILRNLYATESLGE